MALRKIRLAAFLGAVPAVLGMLVSTAWAAQPKEKATSLDQKAFYRPELRISTANRPLAEALSQMPNRGAWELFLDRRADRARVPRLRAWIDPRSGAASNLLVSEPLVPGDGAGNALTLAAMGAVRRPGAGVDESMIGSALMRYVQRNRDVLGIDLSQLGPARVTQISPELWQVSIPQQFGGVRVRDARLLATISHGNLVLVGTEVWGDVHLPSAAPTLGAAQALEAGFAYADGRSPEDVMLREPTLGIVPVAPAEFEQGEGYVGPVGSGYGHRLVWTFEFQRPPDDAHWEMMVDAASGEVIALQDKNLYDQQQIRGGAYPVTDTGICPTPGTCGTMQPGTPMPFADTGLASPNNFTNSAGIFNYTSGNVTTTLTGRYVDIVDTCGAVSETGAGTIDLGGTNNQHDCTSGRNSTGDTPAARTAFYEVNKLFEQARGWLPNNTWLQSRLTTNVNLNQTCNAFWNGTTINFFRSGGGCRNTGEIAGVFDHEWGHGLDDNDAAGALSNSSEAYADVAAIYRLQTSCLGHGFFQTVNDGCGQTSDGTGFNVNEAQAGAAHCDLDCSGVRDADWNKHADHAPDTALGFVCGQCSTGSGPCGREVHCAAAPVRQAAWDLAARDLQSAPFNLDSQTAFIVANRIFFQGSGNIGSWHSCTCGSTSSGCGAANGYMQWLAADDDNGNLSDGTPHMTAIFNAFNRHGIACATPAPTNSGCSAGPSATPATLSVTPGNFSNALSWSSVAGATRYWVFRSEGQAGCNFGKALIATVSSPGTAYTDTQVANGRTYYYNVVAAGTSNACFGQASACVNATPAPVTTPDFTLSCSPSSLTVPQGSSGTTTCTVASQNSFASAVALSCLNAPAGVTCAPSPASVTPPANGSATSTFTITVSSTAATGSFTLQAQGTSGALTHTASLSLSVPAPGPVTVFFDNFETDLGWVRNASGTDTATTGLWERGIPQATNSSGPKQLATTPSGVNDLVTARLAGASAGVNDIDGGTTSIQSPAITLPATGTLTLSFSSYFSHGSNSTSADFFRVRVVGTTTNTVVFQTLGAATDLDAVFAAHSVSLNAFAGQTIRIVIEAADAATASLVEAAVDDVRITQQ
jgi:hypothetical protein